MYLPDLDHEILQLWKERMYLSGRLNLSLRMTIISFMMVLLSQQDYRTMVTWLRRP